MPDPTDGELATLALNGGERAFARLLDRHGNHLRRLLARRMRDPDELSDVMQETHLAIWRALRSYDARRPFEGWLTTIALNKCRDWMRYRRARAKLLEGLERERAGEPSPAHTQGIEYALIVVERVRALECALEHLPAQMRDPLLLSAVSDLPQASIGRELGITRKAVEMRIRRAREHLAGALRERTPSASCVPA